MHENTTALILAALLTSASLAPTATHAEIVKCVDAQGKVSHIDRACPQGSTQEKPARDFQEELRKADERIEAKRLEKQALCNRGDRKACGDVVCFRTLKKDVGPDDYRACSKAKGYKVGANWAQMSEFRAGSPQNGGDSHVTVHCLTPELLSFGSKDVKMYFAVNIRARDVATAAHERNRFYSDKLSRPDFTTWEAAADAACSN